MGCRTGRAALLLLAVAFVAGTAGFGQHHDHEVYLGSAYAEERQEHTHQYFIRLPGDTQKFARSLFAVDDGRVLGPRHTLEDPHEILLQLDQTKLPSTYTKLDTHHGPMATQYTKRALAMRGSNGGERLQETGDGSGSTEGGDDNGKSAVKMTVHYNTTHTGPAMATITDGEHVQLTIGDMPQPENATEVCAFCDVEHGHCEEGACKCDEGYSGPDCTMSGLQTPTCPDWCIPPRGHCTSGPFGRALCMCQVGFGGADCLQKREMLVFRAQHALPIVQECPDCGSHGKCGAGPWDRPICYCEKGFTGPSCGDAIPPAPPVEETAAGPGGVTGIRQNPNDMSVCAFCSANGECVNGTCQCYFGWGGVDCLDVKAGETPCPNNCFGHGTCKDGACMCEAPYTGGSCEVGPCPKSCSNHGNCFEGKCNCDLSWVGEDCGTQGNACPGQCSSHGACQDDKTCKCESGWQGDDCAKRGCPGGGNCNGNGKCTGDGYCICQQGFSGAECENKKCENDCSNNGECHAGVCKCNVEWTGNDCSMPNKEEICPKSESGVCSNHGTCKPEKKVCECFPGFAGVACTELECPNGCSGHGTCKGDKTCACEQHFFEADCSKYSRGVGCAEECNSHGECKDAVCVCDKPFTGDTCSTMGCPADCNGHGSCKNGECYCETGYYGLACNGDRCPFNCSGHGECPTGSGGCRCDTGYAGDDCSQDMCPNNCSCHGRCQDNMCVCDPGFSGEDCGIVRGATAATAAVGTTAATPALDERAVEATPELVESSAAPAPAPAPAAAAAAAAGGGWTSGLRANKSPSPWEISPDGKGVQGPVVVARHSVHRRAVKAPLVVHDDDSDEPGYRDSQDSQEVDVLPKA